VNGAGRQSSATWNGERLFLHYDWSTEEIGSVVSLRLQHFPREGRIWIGRLEVHPDWRQRSLGTRIVRAIEEAAERHGVDTIQLFSRFTATGFWRRMGFIPENDPRYLRKRLLPA
jgi:GNAT superfamily N-acetyltransferase